MVTRNNLHLTKAAVKSVLSMTETDGMSIFLLVVDNSSTDGTASWLHTKSTVATYHLKDQYSLAKCWNIGLKTLLRSGYKEALVINNDVELRPDTYELLSGYGADFVTGVGTSTDIACQGVRDAADLESTENNHPDFSCFMIRKTVTDRVGWFDEDYYPAFYEDNDYHVRMHRAGIRAVSVDVPFLHHGSQTIKQAEPGEQKLIMRYADLNKERFRQKYGCVPGTPEYDKLFL